MIVMSYTGQGEAIAWEKREIYLAKKKEKYT